MWDGNAPYGALRGHYYWGSMPIAYYTSDTHFQHLDWLGTARLQTSYNGTAEATYTSLPWGDGFTDSGSGVDGGGSSSDDAYHFAGLDHDYETDTDHATFRQYDNTQGRWMSPDPYSGSYDINNPQSMNRYSYVLNRPLAYVDPDGTTCESNERCSVTGGGDNGHGGCKNSNTRVTVPGGGNSCENNGCSGIPGPKQGPSDGQSHPGNHGGSGAGAGNGHQGNNNHNNHNKSNQPKHFWQKPGCGQAVGEVTVGVVGSVFTIGTLFYAPELEPEIYEGAEGLLTLSHVVPVAAPGSVLLISGVVGIFDNCN